MKPDSDNSVGAAASTFIDAELDTERDRKSSLESRGLGVITTSGTLVTLLFALAALVTQVSGFSPTNLTRSFLAGAAIFFVVAAVFGIWCNTPIPYFQVDPASLVVLVEPSTWIEDGVDARRELAAARLAELADSRARNESKARLLAIAVVGEVLGIAMTATGILSVLLPH